jgi:hypothetical protein
MLHASSFASNLQPLSSNALQVPGSNLRRRSAAQGMLSHTELLSRPLNPIVRGLPKSGAARSDIPPKFLSNHERNSRKNFATGMPPRQPGTSVALLYGRKFGAADE